MLVNKPRCLHTTTDDEVKLGSLLLRNQGDYDGIVHSSGTLQTDGWKRPAKIDVAASSALQ